MTYNQIKSENNVPISLFCDWGGGNKEDYLKPSPSKSQGKAKPLGVKRVDKFAIFVSDNCAIGGARNRTLYVKELMKYVNIDSYGTCLHNKDFPSGLGEMIT